MTGQRPPRRRASLARSDGIRAALELVRLVARGGASVASLGRALGVSRPSVFRLLRLAREQLGVRVGWRADLRAYEIEDWGVLDARRMTSRAREADR